MMIILNPSPGEVVLIEEPLSWTVNVKSFPTACQVGGDDGDKDDDGDDGDGDEDDDEDDDHDDDNDDDDDDSGTESFPFKKGCVRTVGRTAFPSPQHPNAVYCCHSCFAKYRWDNKVLF